MSSKEKASVEVSLDGTDAVVSDSRRIDQAITNWGNKAKEVSRQAGAGLLNMAGTALQAASALNGLSIVSAIEQAKQLDMVTARLGQSAKVSGDTLKSSFNAAESKTLTSANAMAEFSKALGRTTYDGRFAVDAVSALSAEALSIGRDLGDELPLGVALYDLGVSANKIVPELGRVRDMAERIGTIGGPTALKDTLAALGPELQTVAADTDEARAKLEALVAVLGKGLRPEQAKAVSGGALGMVRSRALDIERVLGRDVLDENGKVKDPAQVLADLKKLAQSKFGKNQAGMRRALISDFGADLGLAILRTNFSEVDKLAASAKDTGKTQAEAEQFRQTPEGKRLATQLRVQQDARGAAGGVNSLMDKANDTLGPWGTMIAGYTGGKVLQGAASWLMRGGAAAVSGGAAPGAGGTGLLTGAGGLLGSGLALMSGAFVGSAALQGQVLSEIGQNRETMGQEWRSAHAKTIGAELAQQAYQAGDLMPIIGRAGGDKEIQSAMLESLSGLLAASNETKEVLRGQVAAGIAAELQRQPLRVQWPTKNQSEGGN